MKELTSRGRGCRCHKGYDEGDVKVAGAASAMKVALGGLCRLGL